MTVTMFPVHPASPPARGAGPHLP